MSSTLLDPTTYMGEAPDCVDDVLASHATAAIQLDWLVGRIPTSAIEPAPDPHSS